MTIPADSGKKRVYGDHYIVRFLGIPFGSPNLKEATDRAIESAGPEYDALIDGVVSVKSKWYVLFSKVGYEVEGTAIISDRINERESNSNE